MMLSLTVGVAGFEPTTPCSQSRCANRTALHPETWLSTFVSQLRCKDTAFFLNPQTFSQFSLQSSTKFVILS